MQSQLPESGRHPGRWCHFDADAGLPDGPDEVWQAGDFPSAWLYAFAPGPVDAGDTSKEAGLTDRASHEDAPETHSMVLWCMEADEHGFLPGSVIFKRRGRSPGVRGRAFG